MASFFNNISRFGRQNNPKGTNSPKLNPPSELSPQSSLQSPTVPATMPPAQSIGPDGGSSRSRKPLYFFREEHTGLIVKGNFMTLAAKPEHVDEGEWLAHQVVEQYRLLEGLIKVIQDIDANTGLPTCNVHTCPTMSAAEFTYTWLDNYRNPIRIPACQYITLVQKWILGKINDPNIFPTADPAYAVGSHIPIAAKVSSSGEDWVGKPSGFPKNFENDIKSLYRQMFRCYAHLYHGHWLDPFYHLGATKELNTCFVHFINVGRWFGLLNEKDLRPMQPLIDLWQSKDLLPPPKEQPRLETPISA